MARNWHNIISLEDFVEEFETEPTLDKANEYYTVKGKKDLDLLTKQLPVPNNVLMI